MSGREGAIRRKPKHGLHRGGVTVLARILRAGRALGCDDRGATLVEFSLVMIPFFIVLFGIFEIAFVFFAAFELENATNDAARLIRTGQVYAGKIDEPAFIAQVCSRAPILVGCASKLHVDVQSYDTFAQLSPPNPFDSDGNLKNSFTYAPGSPKQVVLVTTFYEWPLLNIVSNMSLSNMPTGNRLLRASAAFRNEPFPE